MRINSKQLKTLRSIFDDPIKSNVLWSDIESLLMGLGAEISEGSGSRVRVYLNGVRAIFHRQHPQNETVKGALKSVRRFLIVTGIHPSNF
jgi:hypothetical protein